MKKDDPCISLCQFDGKTGWCVGCGRTIPETRAWRKLTPYRRTALLRELPKRVAQVTPQDTGPDGAHPGRRAAMAKRATTDAK